MFKQELHSEYPEEEINSLSKMVIEYTLPGYNNSENGQVTIYNWMNDDIIIPDEKTLFINDAIEQLKRHVPVQYILGFADFCGLRFKVTPGVFIPRPETEELVHFILSRIPAADSRLKILDIGTGSGCIAIALKKSLRNAEITGIDASIEALTFANENGLLNNTAVQFLQLNILEHKMINDFGKFDIIVSNPPYIPFNEKNNLPANVRDYEPEIALFAPDDNPLLFYNTIGDFSIEHLKPGGGVYFEIHENYGKQVAVTLKNKGFSDIELRKDMNGKDRMVKGVISKR